jgi:hypothetical protein
MSTMDRREAWLMLAALIEGTKGEAMASVCGVAMRGLCGAVGWMIHDRVISDETYHEMIDQIDCALEEVADGSGLGLGTPLWLEEPGDWVSGTRLGYCLRFAEEA